MENQSNLPLRCQVCGALRHAALITRKAVDRSAEDDLPPDRWVDYFHYCSDTAACVKAAEKWNGYR